MGSGQPWRKVFAEQRAGDGAAERDGDGEGEDKPLRGAIGGEPDVRVVADGVAGGAVGEGGAQLLRREEMGFEDSVRLRWNALLALRPLHRLVDVRRALPWRRRFFVSGLLGFYPYCYVRCYWGSSTCWYAS